MKSIILAIGLALLSIAAAPAATILHVDGQHVAFYYDRFLLEADGGVRVQAPGFTATGDAFSMDLKLNRFVLAGHVQIQNASGTQQGAAISDFLDFDRIYFLPITDSADRWTFLNGDLAHPAKGREMPSDAFALPDTSGSKPYILTRDAVVGSREFIRFGASQVDLGSGMGAYTPLPSYYVNFSTDQHLGENSLAGANFDATYEPIGGANSITAVHARYDTVNKTYLSFEQHLSGPKAYAVFSVNPVTRRSKFWDLLLSYKPSDNFQIRSFTQLHTFQYGLSNPLESGQYTIVQATQGLPHSFLQLTSQFTNFSLIPRTIDPNHGVILNHPFQLQLSGQTFDNRIGRSPFLEHVQYGIGYVHDAYGLQNVGGETYPTIWNRTVGFLVYLPSYKFTNDFNIYRNYYLNASFQKNRTWMTTPHYIDIASTTAGISRVFSSHVNAFLSYNVQNTADVYAHGLGSHVYTPFVPVVGGIAYPGYEAFNGTATFRTLSLGSTYSNNGYFAAPPLDILGREIGGQNYLGEPPYDITADVRARINPQFSIDISRSYYFHYGTRGWSPEFVIQVSK